MEKNLELDVDESGGERVLRIAVASSRAFTRHSGAPTLTADCNSPARLEREVARLESELAEALAEARALFGEQPGSGSAAPRAAAAAAPAPTPAGALRVADLMTREVRTLAPNDSVSLADELMRQGSFRHVVVVDDGVVVGVVSQRDIFFGALAWVMGEGRRQHERRLAEARVKDVMCARVATVDASAPLAEAAQLLRERKIGCLPVVDGEALVGVVTEGDFLSLVAGREPSGRAGSA